MRSSISFCGRKASFLRSVCKNISLLILCFRRLRIVGYELVYAKHFLPVVFKVVQPGNSVFGYVIVFSQSSAVCHGFDCQHVCRFEPLENRVQCRFRQLQVRFDIFQQTALELDVDDAPPYLRFCAGQMPVFCKCSRILFRYFEFCFEIRNCFAIFNFASFKLCLCCALCYFVS